MAAAPHDAAMLENGAYYGRSTLFALAALKPDQSWIIVGSFRTAAAYAGHSYHKLRHHTSDRRISILPMTLLQAYPHLYGMPLSVVFIDGDHSFLGVTQDAALSIGLANVGAAVLCHDVNELFPGVMLAMTMLSDVGVLHEEERVGSLVRYRLQEKPRWLLDPAVYRGGQL